jgi:hypothetical protein
MAQVQVTAWIEKRDRDDARKQNLNLSDLCREAIRAALKPNRERLEADLRKKEAEADAIRSVLSGLQTESQREAAIAETLRSEKWALNWKHRFTKEFSRNNNLNLAEGMAEKHPELSELTPKQLLARLEAIYDPKAQ